MAVTLTKDFLWTKLQSLRKDANIIVLKQFAEGYMGITVEDFVAMLDWIQKGKVVVEITTGYDENGVPIISRTEREPTIEEIKQRWIESGYPQFFEKWLADGLIKPLEMKALFGGEKPWQ